MATYFKSEGRRYSSLGEMSVGMDLRKLNAFANDIGFNVRSIKNKIRDTRNLQNQLDLSWQGAARDNFVKNLNVAVEKLENAVTMEYRDFMSRLQNLADNMYKEDKNMYKM